MAIDKRIAWFRRSSYADMPVRHYRRVTQTWVIMYHWYTIPLLKNDCWVNRLLKVRKRNRTSVGAFLLERLGDLCNRHAL